MDEIRRGASTAAAVTSRGWAYRFVVGWWAVVASASAYFGVAMGEGWAWAVAGMLVGLTTMVAVGMALVVWALVEGE